MIRAAVHCIRAAILPRTARQRYVKVSRIVFRPLESAYVRSQRFQKPRGDHVAVERTFVDVGFPPPIQPSNVIELGSHATDTIPVGFPVLLRNLGCLWLLGRAHLLKRLGWLGWAKLLPPFHVSAGKLVLFDDGRHLGISSRLLASGLLVRRKLIHGPQHIVLHFVSLDATLRVRPSLLS